METTLATSNYASAYADAVVGYLTTDKAHEVYFDLEAEEFRAGPCDDGIAPDDVFQYVSSAWDQGLGKVQAELDPKATGFSASSLHSAIVKAVTGSEFEKRYADYLVRAAESPEDYI